MSEVVTIPADVWRRTLVRLDALKEENERLRKAGNEMHAYLGRVDGTTNGQLPCRDAWDAAKEPLQ